MVAGSCNVYDGTLEAKLDAAWAVSLTGSVTSITPTLSVADAAAEFIFVEYKPSQAETFADDGTCQVLDQGTATAFPLTPSYTTTQPLDVLISAIIPDKSIEASATVTGTGWTTPIFICAGGYAAVDDALNIVAGTYQATLTQVTGGCGGTSGSAGIYVGLAKAFSF